VSGIFYDYSQIIVNYCDGTGHQGYHEEPYVVNGQKIWFRGQANTQEMLFYAIGNLGLNYAESVVVTGQSSGGLAAFTWIDYIADIVNRYNPLAKVVAVPDSGM
jgi:hypothetical protein